MMLSANQQSSSLAVASDSKRLQPVYALMHQSLDNSLESFLKSDERKIDKWFAQHDYATVLFSDDSQMFENINTPGQLADLEKDPSR